MTNRPSKQEIEAHETYTKHRILYWEMEVKHAKDEYEWANERLRSAHSHLESCELRVNLYVHSLARSREYLKKRRKTMSDK